MQIETRRLDLLAYEANNAIDGANLQDSRTWGRVESVYHFLFHFIYFVDVLHGLTT